MFSLMGNCFSCIRRHRQPKRPITLAIFGLDGAGKTTTAKGLIGESLDIAPTVGFNSEKFYFDGFDITLYDLGGGKKIRAIWKNYLAEIYGLIFVVDSDAPDRMEETQNSLQELLEHPQVSGKPLLILANKQDKENAIEELDLCDRLNLEAIVNMNKCPCVIESCSAIKGTGRKMDPNIKKGLSWLCAVIDQQFEQMKLRVQQDIATEEEKRKIEKAAKAERVRKVKEEREIKEAEERERLGIKKEESEEEDEIDGDPFKTLDVKELEKKEAKLKEQKRKKKEMLKTIENEESESQPPLPMDFLRTPRSTRNFGPLSDPLTAMDVSDLERTTDDSATPRSSRLLPPLQEPLGTKFVHDESAIKKKKKKKKREPKDTDVVNRENFTETQKTMQSVSNIEISTRSLNEDREKESEDRQMSGHGKYYTTEDIVDGGLSPREKKSKKKKTRHASNSNGYVLQDLSNPMETEESLNSSVLEDSDIVNATEVKKMKKKIKRNQVMQSNEETTFSTKWNLAEDLPEVESIESTKLRGPNMDDEDVIL